MKSFFVLLIKSLFPSFVAVFVAACVPSSPFLSFFYVLCFAVSSMLHLLQDELSVVSFHCCCPAALAVLSMGLTLHLPVLLGCSPLGCSPSQLLHFLDWLSLGYKWA